MGRGLLKGIPDSQWGLLVTILEAIYHACSKLTIVIFINKYLRYFSVFIFIVGNIDRYS